MLNPKDTYDGAIPKRQFGNGLNLVRLCFFKRMTGCGELAEEQLAFLAHRAGAFPEGACFYLLAL